MYNSLNKKVISKRTGKNTVAMVGFAVTSRDQAPWDDMDTEIWGLNEAATQPWMKRWDRWFQLHPEENFNRTTNTNDPDHPLWLRKSHDKPIYLQDKFDYIPDSVRYPIEEIVREYGNYLTSSFSYMIALAMLEGFERIELYGFEMGTLTEYHFQKAGAEYLIGMALGMGIEVYIPENCSLCTGKMYGYETMELPFRQILEARKSQLSETIPTKSNDADFAKGEVSAVMKVIDLLGETEPLRKLKEELIEEARMKVNSYNHVLGALMEIKDIIKQYDKFLVNVGVTGKQDYSSYEAKNGKA